MITAEREPTFRGVYRTKLLLEAGFLVTRLRELNLDDDAEALNSTATKLIRVIGKKDSHEQMYPLAEGIATLARGAWQKHFKAAASRS